MNFLEEFKKLKLSTPRVNLHNFNCENCDFGNYQNDSKDCYMSFGSGYSERVYYAYWSYNNKFCCDTAYLNDSELCYESVNCLRCYNCDFCRDCSDCNDLEYCDKCKSCHDCFGCCGLRHNKYHIFNEPYSKEEYFEKLKEVSSWPREKILEKIGEVYRKSPRLYIHSTKVENSTGDYLTNVKNCHECFDAFEVEDGGHLYNSVWNKDCYDCSFIGKSTLCYGCVGGGYLYNCDYCVFCSTSSDLEFCELCTSCEHCFGCISLVHKRYHILNKPVSKEEYRRLVPEYKEQLREEGLAGEPLYFHELNSF